MIRCPICSKEFKQLNHNHIEFHGLTTTQFKEQYPDVFLGNATTIAKAKKRSKKRAEEDNIRCLVCNKIITTYDRRRRKFCSKSCTAQYNNKRKKRKEYTKQCLYCKKDFITKYPHSKFCSSNCSGHFRRREKVKILCDNCGNDFECTKYRVEVSTHHFCCNNCKNEFFKNNPHIRGVFARSAGKYAQSTYRKKAFANFKHRCYYCKYDRCLDVLQVHHINNDRTNNKLRNLRIVCPTCHAEVHLGLK